MGMEGVGFMKNLGYSQSIFIKSTITLVRNFIMIAMTFQSFHGAGAIKVNRILRCNVRERLLLIRLNHDAIMQKDWALAKHDPVSIKTLDTQR